MKNNLLSEKLIYTGDSLAPTHLHLCTYSTTEIQESSGNTFQSIKDTLDNTHINWLQVHGMKDTETIREICSHFEIDFLVLQDILNANHPTKIEEHDKYIVLILKLFYPNTHKGEDELDELLQQQVCIILGSNYVLTFLEKETDFFDDVNTALRNDVLKIRSRQTDYLFSVLLNSVMGNYISTISSIDDALEDLEEELLTITEGYDKEILKIIIDALANRLDNYFILLANVDNSSVNFLCSTNSTSELIHCGEIVNSVSIKTGGNGNGSKYFAQGGGKDITNLVKELELIKKRILSI